MMRSVMMRPQDLRPGLSATTYLPSYATVLIATYYIT